MVENTILSICIATYNRSHLLEQLLHQLCKISINNIEFVIVDNCSTDNTYELVKSTNDERVKYFRNNKNIGGQNNFVRSLECATGKYLLYCNDRDLLNINKIEELIDILEKNDCSFAKTSVNHNQNKTKIHRFSAGLEGMKNIGFCHHPTGLIFNNTLLKKHLELSSFYDFQGIYVWDFIAYKLSMYEQVLYIDNGLWEQASDEIKKQNISKYGRQWFDLESRVSEMKFTIGYFKNLCNEYKLDNNKTVALYENLLRYFLYASTYMLNYIKTDEIESKHYGLDGKGIGFNEFKNNFNSIYNEFLDSYIDDCHKYLHNFNRIYKYEFLKNYLAMKVITPNIRKKLVSIISKL